ncbi:hypothetical protein [Limnohabitans sp.]|uniref:hypothetical protein n=1 Tax=Limnohabitans sp. TaxID=1907725 RepID=UPI00289E1068|nr:hypothetical protein [Limnohabitans sp.]
MTRRLCKKATARHGHTQRVWPADAFDEQAPKGADGKAFLRDNAEHVNTLVSDQVVKFKGIKRVH